MPTLDPGLASVVLDAVSDDDFELFGQAILNHVLGIDFEATGGMHDGGQDGFVQPVKGKTSHYVQISRLGSLPCIAPISWPRDLPRTR